MKVPAVVALVAVVAVGSAALGCHWVICEDEPADETSVQADEPRLISEVAEFPGEQWTRLGDPGEFGWSMHRLEVARAYSEGLGSDSVLIVQDGVIVDEWGDPSRRLWTYSIRKSLLNALVGRAVDDGDIELEATLEQLDIDDRGSLTDSERQATVRDLLRSRSGVYHDAALEHPGWKERRPPRGSHPPGEQWHYNNWDHNVLGVIYREQTGRSIDEAFGRDIADPLGMQDFQRSDVQFILEEQLSDHEAYGFEMSGRDLARFGLLYLRGGRWENRQVLSDQWVERSTQGDELVDRHGGYEYLWWVEVEGHHFEGVDLGGGAFSARGGPGHFLVVVPAYDLVVVHRVDGAEVDADGFAGLLGRILDAAP